MQVSSENSGRTLPEGGYESDFSWYYMDDIQEAPNLEINGRLEGNEMRFVNHGNTPNVEVEHTLHKGQWVLFFTAKQDIQADEQLLISYGEEYWKKLIQNISRMWCNPAAFPNEEIKKIKEPILIIAGDRDEASSVDECVKMYKKIPNAELAIIPNGTHDVYETKQDLFNKVVLEFLLRYME